MAGQYPVRTCYTCGSTSHFQRDCPRRAFGCAPATGANATPLPSLTLPAPNSVSASATSTANVGYAVPNYSFQPRPNWWKMNQEKLDRCYARTVTDEEKEAKMKEEEERKRKLKEEDDRKEEWRKEQERLEAEIWARLDKRMENVCPKLKMKEDDNAKLKEDMERLRKENEKLRKLLLTSEGEVGEDSGSKLQREIAELKRQVAAKKSADDDIFAMKKEIEELRVSALSKGNFEAELEGLRTEVSRLKVQSLKDKEENELWKGEALRSGNKRGNIVISTPDCAVRGSPQPRWTDNLRDSDKWRQEYLKMKEMHRAAALEAEVLKDKQVVAEGEVFKLKEQLQKQPEGECSKQRTPGATNLKTRLEAVATRSARKGKKATPRRCLVDDATSTGDANGRFLYIEEQKKDLRN
ncbi:hypothetical protein CBR_g55028 [Chara braunii]|uniref:CCHC-type domain-containing protein n=1 Tax=Chara braunii TaxID=69332 RepID=A0A388MCR7_CHABU|nr:hypothetical protein CBR_g55028 [Chara braunii]|eukprot:GBG92259.1 hypothetical protein CBR_g55028 [Chara braunii]